MARALPATKADLRGGHLIRKPFEDSRDPQGFVMLSKEMESSLKYFLFLLSLSLSTPPSSFPLYT